jgi:integrase/recombinase XerD
MIARPEDGEWLFPAAKTGRSINIAESQRMNENSLSRLISRIGQRAGVHAYPHRFRHTFALTYLRLGGDPYSLQYLLGHEDMVTVREYVKIAAVHVQEMYKSPLDAL